MESLSTDSPNSSNRRDWSIDEVRAYFATASRKARKRKLTNKLSLSSSVEYYARDIVRLKCEAESLERELQSLEVFDRTTAMETNVMYQTIVNESLKKQLKEHRFLVSQCKTFFNAIDRKLQEKDGIHSIKENVAHLLYLSRTKETFSRLFSPIRSTHKLEDIRMKYKVVDDFISTTFPEEAKIFSDLDFINLKYEVRHHRDEYMENWVTVDIYDIPVKRTEVFEALKELDVFSHAMTLDRRRLLPKDQLSYAKVFMDRPLYPSAKISLMSEEKETEDEKKFFHRFYPQVKTGLMGSDSIFFSTSHSNEEEKKSFIICTALPSVKSSSQKLDSYGSFFMRYITITEDETGEKCNIHIHSGHKLREANPLFEDEINTEEVIFSNKLRQCGFSKSTNLFVLPEPLLKHCEVIIKGALILHRKRGR